MFANAIATIRNHPFYVVAGLAIGFVLYLMFTSGDDETVAAGDGDIYSAQNSAATQMAGMDLQYRAQTEMVGAQLEGKRIDAATNTTLANIMKDVELVRLDVTARSTDLANTLTANVASKQIQSVVDVEAIKGNVSMSNTQTMANALVQQSAHTAAVSQASIAAVAQASKRSCGLLGAVFGC